MRRFASIAARAGPSSAFCSRLIWPSSRSGRNPSPRIPDPEPKRREPMSFFRAHFLSLFRVAGVLGLAAGAAALSAGCSDAAEDLLGAGGGAGAGDECLQPHLRVERVPDL